MKTALKIIAVITLLFALALVNHEITIHVYRKEFGLDALQQRVATLEAEKQQNTQLHAWAQKMFLSVYGEIIQNRTQSEKIAMSVSQFEEWQRQIKSVGPVIVPVDQTPPPTARTKAQRQSVTR
jgi:ribosomal protein L9